MGDTTRAVVAVDVKVAALACPGGYATSKGHPRYDAVVNDVQRTVAVVRSGGHGYRCGGRPHALDGALPNLATGRMLREA
jgi:hypothetical protein